MRRSEIPEALLDPSSWPGVDASALSPEERELYLRNEAAVVAWLASNPIAQIERQHNINRRALSRLVDRCLAQHDDGRIAGFRALLRYNRLTTYRREAIIPKNPQQGGLAGAFGQLLERFPQLASVIERDISSGKVGLSDSGRVFGLQECHLKFRIACREVGLTHADYPLNGDEKGYRSLSRWIGKRLRSRLPIRSSATFDDAWRATVLPFSTVELDGHKLDLRVRVRFIDASGIHIDLETERLFVITLIDVCTRIVIGWHLVPASEYDHHDVLTTIQNALKPRRLRPDLPATGQSYQPSAGFVADVLPALNYACWDLLKLDNAASHLTAQTFEPICRLVRCRIEAGPVAEPKVRPHIERFFSTLTERMSRKIEGTTGRSVNDPAGKRGRTAPTALLITLPELEEMLDISIANYHGTPHDGLQGKTPLEALQFALQHSNHSVRTLSARYRDRLHQLQPVHASTVRGSIQRSVAPYISLYGARYSSDVLQRTHGLIGQTIRVYIRPDDMREAWGYLANGAELGKLTVLDGWRHSRHTLKLRKFILHERRVGKLNYAIDQDPVMLFAQAQKRKHRRTRRDATIALQLEQVGADGTQDIAPKRAPKLAPLIPVDLSDLKMQSF